MNRIVQPADDFRWTFRQHPSIITGTPYGENFAVTFTRSAQCHVEDAIAYTRRQLVEHRIPRGGGWEVYRRSVDVPYSVHECPSHCDNVDDWTDDFDYPDDYDRWHARRVDSKTPPLR